MRKNHQLKLLVLLVAITSILTNESIHAQSVSITTKKAIPKVCKIAIGDAHISSYMYNSTKLRYLKINVKSECDHYQSVVDIYLTIFKFDPIHGSTAVRTFDNLNQPKSGFVVEMQNAKILCVNNTPTRYYAIARAYVAIPGKGYFEKLIQSQNTPTVPCGLTVN